MSKHTEKDLKVITEISDPVRATLFPGWSKSQVAEWMRLEQEIIKLKMKQNKLILNDRFP